MEIWYLIKKKKGKKRNKNYENTNFLIKKKQNKTKKEAKKQK